MTTVVIFRTAVLPMQLAPPWSLYLDSDVRRIGDDVKHRRPLLGLRNQRLDLVLGRVGIDVVGDRDAAEAVADVAVDAEDAGQIHRSLDGRRDLAELNPAMLGNRGYAGGEAASQGDEHELNRRRALILRGEDLRVVGLEAERCLVLLLAAEA